MDTVEYLPSIAKSSRISSSTLLGDAPLLGAILRCGGVVFGVTPYLSHDKGNGGIDWFPTQIFSSGSIAGDIIYSIEDNPKLSHIISEMEKSLWFSRPRIATGASVAATMRGVQTDCSLVERRNGAWIVSHEKGKAHIDYSDADTMQGIIRSHVGMDNNYGRFVFVSPCRRDEFVAIFGDDNVLVSQYVGKKEAVCINASAFRIMVQHIPGHGCFFAEKLSGDRWHVYAGAGLWCPDISKYNVVVVRDEGQDKNEGLGKQVDILAVSEHKTLDFNSQ